MLTHLSSYQTCIDKSEKVYWDLKSEVDKIELDFTKPFLPKCLSGFCPTVTLTSEEKLRLNQLHGYSYAHLFQFVEEFIIAQILLRAQEYQSPTEREKRRALMRFCEEEVKHQKLFQAFKDMFTKGIPGYLRHEGLTDRNGVSAVVLQNSELSVMLFISMLEWVTQKHYVYCFKDNMSVIDSGFKQLFKLHWLEEAQHTELDSLEIDKLVNDVTECECTAAVDGFIGLCGMLDELLHQQAELDVENFEGLIDRTLSRNEKGYIFNYFVSSYRWMFIGCGLEHPIFNRIVTEICPDMESALQHTAAVYS